MRAEDMRQSLITGGPGGKGSYDCGNSSIGNVSFRMPEREIRHTAELVGLVAPLVFAPEIPSAPRNIPITGDYCFVCRVVSSFHASY